MPQIHHSDVIGSLLRPRYLQQARDAYEAGQLRMAANLGTSTARVPAAGSGTVLLASDQDISVNSATITLPPASFAVVDSASAALRAT